MSEAQHFRPDADYCVYCHARAAGRCASCRALVCADCAELVTGGKSFAICRDCGRRTSLGRGWVSLLWPFLLGAVVLGLVLWLLHGWFAAPGGG